MFVCPSAKINWMKIVKAKCFTFPLDISSSGGSRLLLGDDSFLGRITLIDCVSCWEAYDCCTVEIVGLHEIPVVII